MSAPFTHHEGWQAIFRRVIQQQQKVGSGIELMTLEDHHPDRPFNRAEIGLELQRWRWQV
jgi:hypothetical protein